RQSSFRAIAAASKSAIWLRTVSRSSGSAIASGVSPTRLRRGATSTPALLRRAIASLLRPPPAIGIEAKSCSEFRAEELPILILERPGRQLPPRLRQTKVWRSVASPRTRAKRLRSCRGEVIRHGHLLVRSAASTGAALLDAIAASTDQWKGIRCRFISDVRQG